MTTPLFSRRLFLQRGAQLLSVAGTLPLFLDHSAHALAADYAANPQGAGRPDRILVVIQLAGGNDGLNTVVPIRNDNYYRARPKLGIARQVALRLTDDFGVHPAAAGLKKLYDAGHLAVVHAVGYPNPNRSHFRATDIWATAEPDRMGQSGWLGRYFDACCNGHDPGPKPAPAPGKSATTAAEPSDAIALLNESPLALQGDKFLPLAFRTPDSLTYRDGVGRPAVAGAFNKLNDLDDDEGMMARKPAIPMGTAGSLKSDPVADDFLQRTALNARVYADKIKRTATSVQNKAKYPDSRLATDLKLVAQMIASGLPTRVYYVTLGGFDTHSQQANRHERLMTDLGGAMAAFVEDLKALGHLDRTTVMTFIEFGRRVTENGSAGTDHGEAAPLFIAGGAPLKPGFHGTAPTLDPATLHRGDVPFNLDFRRIYATVLKTWLRADDTKVLGKKFDPIELYKTLA